jgi:hypothetical protein
MPGTRLAFGRRVAAGRAAAAPAISVPFVMFLVQECKTVTLSSFAGAGRPRRGQAGEASTGSGAPYRFFLELNPAVVYISRRYPAFFFYSVLLPEALQ